MYNLDNLPYGTNLVISKKNDLIVTSTPTGILNNFGKIIYVIISFVFTVSITIAGAIIFHLLFAIIMLPLWVNIYVLTQGVLYYTTTFNIVKINSNYIEITTRNIFKTNMVKINTKEISELKLLENNRLKGKLKKGFFSSSPIYVNIISETRDFYFFELWHDADKEWIIKTIKSYIE